jgi:hypothetical protein
MPSQLHEAHLLLFRNQPTLAVDLIRDALHVDLPRFTEARIVSADLTDIQPAEYRADMVIQLFDAVAVLGIVLEVQLSVDERKRFVWPAYVANLRARLECPVCLLVVTADDTVAKWARRPVEMGGLYPFVPYVLGPSSVPQVMDEAVARSNPELAVLSAMAHGGDDDAERSIRIATVARSVTSSLDADRSKLYFDLILHSLSEAAREALITMEIRKYEYQSEFARRYVKEGRAEMVSHLLGRKFGALDAEIQRLIAQSSSPELEAMADRLLTAGTLSEVLSAVDSAR